MKQTTKTTYQIPVGPIHPALKEPERICGICSYCHPMAFALATERAAGIEVPERAQYLRVIQQELERICSHVLWAGVAAHEIGFDTVLFLTWQMREKALDLTEYLCGNRVTKGITMIGGVRRDITKDMINISRITLKNLDIYF